VPVPLTIQKHADHIAVAGTGLYTLLEAQEHFRDLSAVIGEYRKAKRAIRVLVDLRDGAPQIPEVVSHIEKVNQIIFREGDRVAIIVLSALLKFQVKRIHARFESEAFISDAAAGEFLFRNA
jgi:hypothetical protein